MNPDIQPNPIRGSKDSNVAIGARTLLRQTICQCIASGDYPTTWSLRIGFVELIQLDTHLVLGYKPDRVDIFMGLPITTCPSGTQNRLITTTGSIAIPDLGAVRRTKSYAND